MLDYFKVLLRTLQFDAALFKKEYKKSLQYLAPTERRELKNWLKETGLAQFNNC